MDWSACGTALGSMVELGGGLKRGTTLGSWISLSCALGSELES